uniref:Glutamate decarboxylase 1 n=1 Tax=Heterorhabditis bacteriophora TaxID=37862 RepID=A0A1I7W9M0_HETBA
MPENLQSLLKNCEDVLRLGVRTGHPRFFNQISCGLDIVSMAAEWLTATANTNMYVYYRRFIIKFQTLIFMKIQQVLLKYFLSPVFILMEKEVMRKMWEMIGWDVDKADGIFAPGGAIANLYALNTARHNMFPRSKYVGVKDVPTLCAFTSEDFCCSIYICIFIVKEYQQYFIYLFQKSKMIPEALEQKIIECKKDGLTPLFVCCTAGTTVYGAWDPIERIADICERHKIWLHVDAAWGGGLLLSPEHRYRLAGIERANSVTWNPHKLMGALLQCSACLFRQDDKPYDVSYDTGDKAIQCGRHNDVFKLWLMWKSKGMEGYRQQINRLMDLSAYFTLRIRETEGYELVVDPPEFLNICFWYIPSRIRDLDPAEKKARLEKVELNGKTNVMRLTRECGRDKYNTRR